MARYLGFFLVGLLTGYVAGFADQFTVTPDARIAASFDRGPNY